MVGSKGLQSEWAKNPSAYVEPAKPTPGEPLNHFRLAGPDKVWHTAEARIEGNSVLVTSPNVPEPRGIQYAYCATPMGANLYNEAGLPALPFATFDGVQMFNEDDPAIVAAAKAEAERKWGKKTNLQPATLFRDGVVLQHGARIPVWGHGHPGTQVTIRFGDQEKRGLVDEFERWKVTLDPLVPSKERRTLTIEASNGDRRTVQDVLVGDVFFVTGARRLASELMKPAKEGQDPTPPLELVREFRIKTKARRFRTPRKKRMEIGGGRYLASWQPVTLEGPGDAPSVVAYHFASQVRKPGIPCGIITLGADNPPLTWVSPQGMQDAAGFERERDMLNLAFPNTDVCKRAVKDYVTTLTNYYDEVAAVLRVEADVPAELADKAPAFPEPPYDQWAATTEIATHTYNFCISPLTPCAVRGVVWIPGEKNIGSDPSRYGAAVGALINSLPETFGQESVPFYHALPATELAPGSPAVNAGNTLSRPFTTWKRSLASMARDLGALATQEPK